MHEIEVVTKMTNDYICDSNGVIVTEYCKKEATWTRYRDNVRYVLSPEFFDELISILDVKEKAVSAKKEKKEENNLQDIMKIVNRGAEYWRKLILIAQQNSIAVSYQELSAIKSLIDMAETGNIPSTPSGKIPSRVAKAIETSLKLEEKLKTEGLLS